MLQLVNYHILNTTANYAYTPYSLADYENWFRKKEEEQMPILVADLDGQFQGFATYGIFRPKEAYQFSIEHSVYVLNEQQGRGIGKALMLALIDRAEKEAYHTMIAGVDASNLESLQFHKKLGFEQVAHFKEVGFKFHRWHDIIFLQRMLKPKS